MYPSDMRKLVLASSSPRRYMIMRELELEFDVNEPNSFEEKMDGSDPINLVKYNANGKAKEIADQYIGQEAIVIACDTVIVDQDNRIFGKPGTRERATYMLSSLRGKQHSVYSGIAVIDTSNNVTKIHYDKTLVKFRDFTDAELNDYVSTAESFDKAGAYDIQGRGIEFVEEIEGSFSNIVGLPKELLVELLGEIGYEV